MQEKIEDIKHIQNTVWAMYKDFLADHDMGKYNQKMGELVREYQDKGDRAILCFCQNILISWGSIINGFAEEFRNSE